MSAYRRTDIHEAVRDALLARGCPRIPDSLPVGRWFGIAAPNKRPGNDAMRVKIAEDGQVAWINDMIEGGGPEPIWAERPSDPAERDRLRRLAEAGRVKRERERRARQAVAIAECDAAWSAATPCGNSAYTRRKGLKDAHGARWDSRRSCLLVRYQRIDGTTSTLQRIDDDGTKRCWPGAPVKGAFALLGPLAETTPRVIVAEGWATAATVAEETGETTVAAMFAGNLQAVCEALRSRFADTALTVAGDDDRATAGNPGRTKATKAARMVGGRVVFPPFCRPDCPCSDFNDVSACERRRGGGR